MNFMKISRLQRALIVAGLSSAAFGVRAQVVVNDTLTGTASQYRWLSIGGACLTAGDKNVSSSIPPCVGPSHTGAASYYGSTTQVGGTTGRLPDADGHGALRLTNGAVDSGSGGTNQTGAIISNFVFPNSSGIQVTWTSVTYGGNNYNGTGADGISFFLVDGGREIDRTDTQGTYQDGSNVVTATGGLGGSLGYSCSNGNSQYDGVNFGYLGVGIDEYGNFSNPGDNTDTGPGYYPGRVAVRGAGYTSWTALTGDFLADGVTANPWKKYYSTGQAANKADAIHKSCKAGYFYNYSGGTLNGVANGSKTADKIPFNYPILASKQLVDNSSGTPVQVNIANQEATNMPTRGAAQPLIFALKITSAGVLDLSYSQCSTSGSCGASQSIISAFDIKSANGPFPSWFRFGFSAGTGGGSNVHEITCFKATQDNVGNTSAGSNVQQAGQIVLGGLQVFLAYYHPVNWWGSLTANTLSFDSVNDRLTANTVANWDANCVLTGGTCSSTNTTVTAQDSSHRNIVTWNNNVAPATGAGIPFQYSNLTSTEQTTLGGNSDLVNYLRGDRSKEISQSGGTFRNRTSVLGDIVDSSPTFVGAPAFNYGGPWSDKLSTSTTMPEGTSYTSWASGKSGRMNVVYVGAGDGLLHAFQAGTVASGGGSITSNTGAELFAYMPGQVLNAIHAFTAATSTTAELHPYDYASTSYVHNFQVDGTPGSGDLYYNGTWHTWLVGGLGAGGHPNGPVNSNTATVAAPVSAIYALDITDPTTVTESGAASLVLGEWNSSTISCAGNATCGTNLGQVSGTPLIRRLHDGNWAVIFGNGLNSTSGHAGLFIMHVDSATGARTFQYIDAGAAPGNGIVDVTAADLDGDHITDFVYAGDVQGNLWRFDLTSSTNTNWNLSSAITPLFKTSAGQPITTAPVVAEIPPASSSGQPKLIVAFGTGQKLPLTNTEAEKYASGTQSLYGIWDSNLSTWNSTSTDEKYDTASISAGTTSTSTPAFPLAPGNLTSLTVTNVAGTDGGAYRTVSFPSGTTAICWFNSTVCTSGNNKVGYEVDLPGTNEQVIYNPQLIEDSFVVNTLIPGSQQAITCGKVDATGYTMAIDIINGSDDNAPYTDGTNYYAGFSQNGAGVVTQFNYNGKSYDGTETNTGGWTSKKHLRRGGTLSRLTWTKIR